MSTRPLRVAHVVATAGRSGVERHLEALLPSFDRGEVEPRLFVPGPGPLVDALAARGVRAEPGAPTRKLAWREAEALAARLRDTCDVLHAHGPRAAFWAARVARRAHVPAFVCTVHELRWRSLPPGPRRSLWVAFEAWAMRHADRLVVLSRTSETAMRERFPDLASRLVLIPGSTPMLLDDTGPPPGPPPRTGPLRVVSVGRLDWVKGQDRLLEAVARASSRGVRLELRIAGDGPLGASLRSRARALGLAGLVQWSGGAFDPRQVLEEADAFVSASRSETFGIAALEAMACGLPVVSTVNGGVDELFEDHVSGLVIPGATEDDVVEGLARALAVLAGDPVRRAALGAAAAQRARRAFSPRAMADATARVYALARSAG